MKTMDLAQLNLAIASGFLKLLIGMTNPGSAPALQSTLSAYVMREGIPDYLKVNTLPDEVTAFSSTIEIIFAILMLIIDKLAPPDNPQTVPQPTKIDSGVSQRLSSVFLTVKTNTPAEVKIQAEDAHKIMRTRPPPEIEQIFNKRVQELFPQVVSEMRTEILKITPEELVSYPIWSAIVKETIFSVGELNPVNYLFMIGYKTVFKPIRDELQNQDTSSSTTTQAQTTTQAETTTTKPKISLPPKYAAILSRRVAKQQAKRQAKQPAIQTGGQQSTTTRRGPVVPIGSIPGKLW